MHLLLIEHLFFSPQSNDAYGAKPPGAFAHLRALCVPANSGSLKEGEMSTGFPFYFLRSAA